MNKCGWDNCFTCPYKDCIVDDLGDKPVTIKPAPSRREYQHNYYLSRKDRPKEPPKCFWCEKELKGHVILFDRKKFCDMNCVICHMIKKNEDRMQDIVV